MLQREVPCDLVFGTGETHAVRDFLDEAFGYVDLDWKEYVVVDSQYYRPTEVEYLQVDASEAKRRLGRYRSMSMSRRDPSGLS